MGKKDTKRSMPKILKSETIMYYSTYTRTHLSSFSTSLDLTSSLKAISISCNIKFLLFYVSLITSVTSILIM